MFISYFSCPKIMHLFHPRQASYVPFQAGLLLHPPQVHRQQLTLTVPHATFFSVNAVFPVSLTAQSPPSRPDSSPAFMNSPSVSCLAGYPVFQVPTAKHYRVPWRQTLSEWKAVQGRKTESWKEGNGTRFSTFRIVCCSLRCHDAVIQALWRHG